MGSVTWNNPQAGSNPFVKAVKIYARVWKKHYGYQIPPPEVSHALSNEVDGVWHLVCAETGDLLALADTHTAVLAGDMPDDAVEEVVEPPETRSEASVEELGADIPPAIPMHRYYPKKEPWAKPNQDAVITIKKHRSFHVPPK